MGHCWRSEDRLISGVLLWTSIDGHARTYLHQLCADKGYSLENLPRAMDDRDGWRESGKSMLAVGLDDVRGKFWY